MSFAIVESALTIVFLAVCAACLYWMVVPASSQRPGTPLTDLERAQLPWWRRGSVLRTIVAVLVMGAMLPAMLAARDRVLASMFNNPRDWVANDLPAERRYSSFIGRFQELDAVAISWPDCHVDDERLARLAAELTDSGDPQQRTACQRYFARVVTGYGAIRDLMAPPLSLPREVAIERFKGSLVGPDGTTSGAVVFFREEGVVERGEAIDLLLKIASRVSQFDQEEIILAGAPVDGMTIDRISFESAGRFAVPSNILVFLLCRFCLRTWRLTFVVFGIAMFGQLLSVSLVDFFGIRLNAILVVMPPLVLVLTVSAGVHLANYYDDEVRLRGQTGAARRAIVQGWLPCAVATATTVAGLLSLLASDSRPIGVFGLFSSISVVTTVSLLFLIMPGAMDFWPAQARSGRLRFLPQQRTGDWTQGLAGAVCTARHAILVVCLAVMAVGVHGLTNLNTSVSIREMFVEGSRNLENCRWMEENLGGTVPIEVVVRFDKAQRLSTTDRLRVVNDVHQAVAQLEPLGGVVSAATFLPESPPGSDPLFSRGDQSLEDLVKMRHRLYELPYVRERYDAEYWRISARAPALRDIDHGALLDRLALDVEPVVQQARARLASDGISVSFTGPMPLTYAAQRALLEDLARSFCLALLLITGVMIVYLRSLVAGLAVMLPNLFPTVVLFGFTSLGGTPIDIGSMMTASVALGIAVDDTLHFVTWYRREYAVCRNARDAVCRAYGHCGGAMVQTTLICGLGLMVYVMSPFVPAQRFALMMVALLGAALIGDLLLLPALLAGPLSRLLRPAPLVAVDRPIVSRGIGRPRPAAPPLPVASGSQPS